MHVLSQTRTAVYGRQAGMTCRQVGWGLRQRLARLTTDSYQTKHYRQVYCWKQKFSIANWDYFRTHLKLEICKIPNQLRAACYAYVDQKLFFRVLGCATRKQLCLTAVPNQK